MWKAGHGRLLKLKSVSLAIENGNFQGMSKQNAINRSWRVMVDSLKAVRRDHGRQDDPRYAPLWRWVHQIQCNFAALSEPQLRELQELGFHFGTFENSWIANYLGLIAFWRKEGHFRVSKPNSLRGWVATQRSSRNKLSLERRRLLDRIGFLWVVRNPNSWNERFEELKAFKRRHGHTRVPQKWNPNRKLALWVHHLRHRKGTAEQIQKLNRLGFEWKPLEDRWERNFNALVNFKKKHGHTRVPAVWRDNPELGRWVVTQRHSSEPSVERRRRLQKVGFEWDPLHNAWMKMFNELKTHKKEHGHFRGVPANLLPWIRRQQILRAQGKLRGDYFELLEGIEMRWVLAREDTWENHFAELKKFHRKHGHCRVPSREKRLFSWLIELRGSRNQTSLAPERIKRLNLLGFDWNPLENRWMKGFEELEAFKKRFGHCRVPMKYPLRTWVLTQRSMFRKGRMPPKRQRMLKGLEFFEK